MGELLVQTFESQRSSRRALAAFARLRPVLQCAAQHRQRCYRDHLSVRSIAPRTAARCQGDRAMSGRFRLPSGARLDRRRALRFSFDGKSYQGFAGDTLASALLANGVHLVGRSFKYHRPRGIVTAGSDEPNALVGIGADEAHYTPNMRATQVEVYAGLVAESQKRWPSLGFDVGAVHEAFTPFLTACFYY